MVVTANNIWYDFKVSPFRVRLEEWEFVFSSQLHKTKFLDKYRKHRDYVNTTLCNRFNMKIEVNVIADLQLYTKIEKRGFLIINHANKEVLECQEDIILSGLKKTKKN